MFYGYILAIKYAWGIQIFFEYSGLKELIRLFLLRYKQASRNLPAVVYKRDFPSESCGSTLSEDVSQIGTKWS